MISCAVILIFTMALGLFIGRKTHELLPVTALGSVLLLYCLGLVSSYLKIEGALKLSAYAVWVMGIAAAVVLATLYMRKVVVKPSEIVDCGMAINTDSESIETATDITLDRTPL